jgi:hypothetical protein
VALQRGPVHRLSQHFDEESSRPAAGSDHGLEYGTAPWSVADHLQRDVLAVCRMIKDSVLVEQRSERIGHRGTPQPWKIRVVRIQPYCDLAVLRRRRSWPARRCQCGPPLAHSRQAAPSDVRSASQRLPNRSPSWNASGWHLHDPAATTPGCPRHAQPRPKAGSLTSAEVSSVDPSGSPDVVTDRSLHTAATADQDWDGSMAM